MKFVFACLAVFLVSLSTAGAAVSDAQAVDVSRQAWQVLDYVAVDYGGAVSGGMVKSAGEYAEMREFVATAMQRIDQLPPKDGRDALKAKVAVLRDLVEGKADGGRVAEAAHDAAAALLQVYPFPVAPRQAPDLARGAALFQANCAACHGALGAGNGPMAARLDPHPTDLTDRDRARNRSPFALYQILSQGVAGTAMPSFEGQIGEDDRWALAFFAGGLSYTAADREAGAAQWKSGAQPLHGLDALAQATESGLAAQVAPATAAGLVAYLRANPQDAAALPENLAVSKTRLAESLEAFRKGDHEAARRLALSAYLDGFEPFEPGLRVRDAELLGRIETAMGAYRSALAANQGDKAEQAQQSLQFLLGQAEAALRPGSNDGTAAFLGALTILLREGIEALLVVVAMIAFLRKADRPDVLRYVHAGWSLALAAGGLTWFIATYLVSVSGASRELTEGFSSLFAAVVLLGVGMWMHQKSVAGRWRVYLQEKLSNALTRRTGWFLFSLAFVAVYREVFETVLFFAALWTQGNGLQLLAGLACGAVLLAGIAAVLLRTSARLPIGQFFAASSVLIAVLAVVLAGKGIAALQEAGMLSVNAAPIPRVELLGLYPTWQTAAAQLVVVVVALAGFAMNTRSAKPGR